MCSSQSRIQLTVAEHRELFCKSVFCDLCGAPSPREIRRQGQRASQLHAETHRAPASGTARVDGRTCWQDLVPRVATTAARGHCAALSPLQQSAP